MSGESQGLEIPLLNVSKFGRRHTPSFVPASHTQKVKSLWQPNFSVRWLEAGTKLFSGHSCRFLTIP